MCSSSEIEIALLEEFLDVALARSLNVFRFSGGEPLLYTQLAELLKLMKKARRHGATVHLNTNGVLLGRILDEVDVSFISSLRISLDSLERGRYREITGTDVLQRVISNIRRAREKGLSVDLIMVVMRHNFHEISSLIDFCREIDAGLKLSDIEAHDYDEQGLWREQFIPLQAVRSTLERMARDTCIHTAAGGLGIAMTDYMIDGVTVRVKDTLASKVYTETCRQNCALYPCPEGVYSILLKADSTMSWCKRNDTIARPLKRGQVAGTLDACLNDLASVRRDVPDPSHATDKMAPLSAHWLNLVQHAKVDGAEVANVWRFVGSQRKYGRDKQ